MKIQPGTSLRLSMLLVPLAFVLLACEDQPPTDYDPKPFLEVYLIVDEPIQNVIVGISQPITQKFDYAAMMDRAAEVVIQSPEGSYALQFMIGDGVASYAYPDTSVRIKPETEYTIRVRTSDGSVMTARTVTPKRMSWIIPPREVLQYPQDTTILFSPDSLRISWTSASVPEYLVRVNVLDTLGYGKYLQTPTDETNERTNNLPFEDPDDPQFYTSTRWGFIQTTQAPTVWAAFRWYGRNEVAILAPDKALADWFKATQWGGRSVEYRPEYSNISGGVGVFGSASVVAREVFVLKRKK
ncbi:MAG: hypothetical protein M5R41_14835 [Bacteroidia bacterium]|nr:hypothetical protein [Bacteroidia bacterium]